MCGEVDQIEPYRRRCGGARAVEPSQLSHFLLCASGFLYKDTRFPSGLFFLSCFAQVIGEEEDVSVYDISDHPDFHFHTTDIVIRIGNSGSEEFSDEVK